MSVKGSNVPPMPTVPKMPKMVAEMKPFYCPNCGGNSYRKVNGKIVCEYCDTEFLTSTIPSENPLKDVRPKPLPTRRRVN